MKKINSHIMYGTAWKEDKTERLTLNALMAGFSSIDTANQRKQYNEEGGEKPYVRLSNQQDQIERNYLFKRI